MNVLQVWRGRSSGTQSSSVTPCGPLWGLHTPSQDYITDPVIFYEPESLCVSGPNLKSTGVNKTLSVEFSGLWFIPSGVQIDGEDDS